MPEAAEPDEDQELREIIAKGVNIGVTFTSAELLGEQMTLADVVSRRGGKGIVEAVAGINAKGSSYNPNH